MSEQKNYFALFPNGYFEAIKLLLQAGRFGERKKLLVQMKNQGVN